MKELSIEEKAKRYDEAIERAKSKIKNDKDHVLYESDVIDIFPELYESGDEMIRKALIKHFSWNTKQILNEFSNKKYLPGLKNKAIVLTRLNQKTIIVSTLISASLLTRMNQSSRLVIGSNPSKTDTLGSQLKNR